jgi:hypothetical protein
MKEEMKMQENENVVEKQLVEKMTKAIETENEKPATPVSPKEYNRHSRRKLTKAITAPRKKNIEYLRQPDPNCKQCKGQGVAGFNKEELAVPCYCITKKDYKPS